MRKLGNSRRFSGQSDMLDKNQFASILVKYYSLLSTVVWRQSVGRESTKLEGREEGGWKTFL